MFLVFPCIMDIKPKTISYITSVVQILIPKQTFNLNSSFFLVFDGTFGMVLRWFFGFLKVAILVIFTKSLKLVIKGGKSFQTSQSYGAPNNQVVTNSRHTYHLLIYLKGEAIRLISPWDQVISICLAIKQEGFVRRLG